MDNYLKVKLGEDGSQIYYWDVEKDGKISHWMLGFYLGDAINLGGD